MRNGLMPFPQMAQAAGAVRYDPTLGRFVPVDQFVDSRFRVTGSVDPTKRVALEVDTNVPTNTTVTLTVPERSIGLQAEAEEKSSNFTAALHGVYVITATCTVTDPTPAQGHEFICFIRNGTATIGGTAYDQPGTMVWRSYHSGAWSNAVLPAISGAYTWTGQQTFSQPILVADGATALPSIARSAGSSTGISFNASTTQISATGTKIWQVSATANQQFAYATGVIVTINRANGNEAAPTKVLSGETLGEYRFGGWYDNGAGTTGYDNAVAGIRGVAAEDFNGTGNTGGYLAMMTTGVGSGSAAIRWRVNAGGQITSGDKDPFVYAFSITPQIQINETSASGSTLGIARFAASNSGPSLYFLKSRSGTANVLTQTQTNDILAAISGQGVDTASAAFEAGRIVIAQDAASGVSAVPGRISIHTATSGGTVTEALRVDSAQQVQHLATTASTSTTTGGSTFAGGVGVAGAVYAGGTVVSTSQTAGIGYATGAGGTVTQITSRTTGVTLNRVTGAITLVSAAGSAAWQSFTVTNSAVAATDTIIVNQVSGTDLNMIHVTNIAAGSFRITFATTGGTTVEQPVFRFTVIKSVSA